MIHDKKYISNLVARDLNNPGYTLTSLNDTGRAYLGQVKKEGKDYYIKIAKSKKESLFLQNSIIFNKNLIKLKPPFRIPLVVHSGHLLNDYYYRIETAIPGTPFATLDSGISTLQINNPASYFKKIYHLIDWLQNQKINLPTNIDKQFNALQKNHNQRLINTMIKWSFNSTPRLSDLLKIAQNNKSVFKSTTAHRDITPINIIITPQKMVGLIDADIAKKAAKYYDIVEFYNRLWTRVCQPELAQRFLKTVISELKGNKDYFYNQFLTISAFRAVGNYWEIMHFKDNHKKRLKYLTSYSNHIADKEFLA